MMTSLDKRKNRLSSIASMSSVVRFCTFGMLYGCYNKPTHTEVVLSCNGKHSGKWVYCARKSTPFKSTATFIQTCIKLYYCQMPDQEAALQLVQARCFAYAKFLGNHPGLTLLKTEGKNHESDFELRKPPSGEWRHSQSIRKRLTNWLVINTSQS